MKNCSKKYFCIILSSMIVLYRKREELQGTLTVYKRKPPPFIYIRTPFLKRVSFRVRLTRIGLHFDLISECNALGRKKCHRSEEILALDKRNVLDQENAPSQKKCPRPIICFRREEMLSIEKNVFDREIALDRLNFPTR